MVNIFGSCEGHGEVELALLRIPSLPGLKIEDVDASLVSSTMWIQASFPLDFRPTYLQGDLWRADHTSPASPDLKVSVGVHSP